MTAAEAVVDASVLIRASVELQPEARIWIDAIEHDRLRGHVPDLAYAEIASALTQSVRARILGAGEAREILAELLALPLTAHRQSALAPASLVIALEDGLSAYDASYVALARSLGAPLVTADRRLAAAVPGAELID